VVALDVDAPDDLVVGAGFEIVTRQPLTVRRLRTLPDRVAAGMHLLVCGLNPSLYAADRGVGFARPGNRFWPAMLAAGLVTIDRDPAHALREHGIGMTDLVKRATVAASEITREEFAAGVARVERLCAWLAPRSVLLVGLAGWRAAVDRKATTGWQARDLGGSPVYVMPNTSGLNASTQLTGFVEHLRAADGGPERDGPA
jgi:TDG/mug DNA glycosylase family protein